MADPSMNNCPNVKQLVELVNEAAGKLERLVNVAPKFRDLMTSANFVDVEQKIIQVSQRMLTQMFMIAL